MKIKPEDLATIHSAHSHGARDARDRERAEWQEAAAERRIKTRKLPSQSSVRVWIEPKA